MIVGSVTNWVQFEGGVLEFLLINKYSSTKNKEKSKEKEKP